MNILNLIYLSRFISFVFPSPKCHYFRLTRLDLGKTFYESGIILYKFAFHVFFFLKSQATNSYKVKTLNIITFACFFFGIYIIGTNFVVISHTINFYHTWLIPIFVYLCKISIKKFSEYVQVLISNKLCNLIVPYLSPKLLDFCYSLICKLNENLKIIIYYLSYYYPTFFWALKRYFFLYSYLYKKYPTLTLVLKEGYSAWFLIVICSFNLDLYIAFSAFTISSLMIIYIRYIDPSFSIRRPVLYWFILFVCLLIIFYIILYLPYIVYVRVTRKKAGGKPTGHKSNKNPGGPPHNNNIDPCMQQSSHEKKKSTSKKTTSKKATEDQDKENERKLRRREASVRCRKKMKTDTTKDENGLTRLDKYKAARARSNAKMRDDTILDENGHTALYRSRAKKREYQRKYSKTENGKASQAHKILSRPSIYD